MILHLDLPQNGYDIILERGVLNRAKEYLKLDRRVLIVTDTGVPAQYAKRLAAQCKEAVIETVPMGEASKSFAVLERLCRTLLENHFTRTDCVVAVGGGVVGDLAGFAAASYMRGIDFYNCPTTVLSQVDSSIGGKVAINLDHVKNIVGAFYQPKAVLIDPEVLSTLPARQISNGLSEAVKMALTSDAALFELFESGRALDEIDTVIERSLRIKKAVVEEDEKETGLRRILNFGHTLGHGVESQNTKNGLYHGECVALGMIPMCKESVRKRLVRVLEMLSLPTKITDPIEDILDAASHDKKCAGDSISVVCVPSVGSFEIRRQSIEDWKNEMRRIMK